MVTHLVAASSYPSGYVVLVPSNTFLRHGFWRPNMQQVHAQVWDALHAMRLRFWSDITREIRVHPADLGAAQAVLRAAAQRADAAQSVLAAL